jgi:hypothetical protein
MLYRLSARRQHPPQQATAKDHHRREGEVAQGEALEHTAAVGERTPDGDVVAVTLIVKDSAADHVRQSLGAGPQAEHGLPGLNGGPDLLGRVYADYLVGA